MPYDVGDTAVLAVDTYDANDVLADVGAMAVTVTLPDGTTTSPVVEHTASSGRYVVRYTTVQAGRHLIRWVGTGANASTHSEAFDVRAANPEYLVSLADTKRKCRIPLADTSFDDELREWIEAATRVVERHTGKTVARRTVTETIRTGWTRTIVLTATPVISLVSVQTADGLTTWDVSDLHVDPTTGVVTVLRGPLLHGDLVVVFVAGMALVPAEYVKAALIIIDHLWQTERGVTESAPSLGDYADSMDSGFRSAGYAIPNRALELLGSPPPLVG